jgi:hypothetical protein
MSKIVAAVNKLYDQLRRAQGTESKTPQCFLIPVAYIRFSNFAHVYSTYTHVCVRACVPVHTCMYRVSYGTSVELQAAIYWLE